MIYVRGTDIYTHTTSLQVGANVNDVRVNLHIEREKCDRITSGQRVLEINSSFANTRYSAGF